MPIYQYEGKHYDLSTTDAAEAKQKILTHLGKSQNVLKNNGPSVGEDLADLGKGVANLGVDIAASVPAGVSAAIDTVANMSMEKGAQTFEQNMQTMQGALPRFRDEGGQRATQFLGEKLDQAMQLGGDASVWAAKNPLMMGPAYPLAKGLQQFSEPAQRGMGEVATNLLPIPGTGAMAAGIKGLRPKPAGTTITPHGVDPNAAVIAKAKEIAAQQGRTEILPDDIRAAEAGTTGMKMPTEQGELDMGAAYTPEEIMAARRQAAQGEVQSGIEQQNWLREQLTKTDDMFNPVEDTRLGPATPGRRERGVVEPGTDVNHLDPIAMNRQREDSVPGAYQPETIEAARKTNVRTMTNKELEKLGTPEAIDEMDLRGYHHGLTKPDPMDAVSQRILDVLEEKPIKVRQNENYKRTVAELAEKGQLRPVLEHISKESHNPFYRWLSDTLLQDSSFNTKIGVYDGLIAKSGNPAAGKWTGWKEAEIKLNREGGWHGSEWTVLHEAVHARTVELLWRYETGLKVPEKVATSLKGIDKLHKYVLANAPKEWKEAHGLKNNYEFIAEAFTNYDFQKMLEDMSLSKDFFFDQRKEGVLNAFKGFIMQILSILRGMGFKQMDPNAPHALAVVLNEGANILREANIDPTVAKMAYGPDGMRWANQLTQSFDAVPEVRKADSKPLTEKEHRDQMAITEGEDFAKRYSKALYGQYMEQWKRDNAPLPDPIGYDNREHKDFRGSLFRSDGKPRLDDVGYIFPAGPAYTMAEAHPVIRRAYDQISQATIEKDNLFNKWFRGAEIIEKGGFNPMKLRFTALSSVKRTENPNSLAVLGKQLNTAEGNKIIELINSYGETHPEYLTDKVMLQANGATPKVIKYLETLKKTNMEVLDAINKSRESKGLARIEPNPNWWLTRVRYGPYQVFNIDKNGKHSYLAGFNTLADAEKVAKFLKTERGMDVSAAPAEHNPKHLEVLPSDAFIEAANLVDDPAARKIVMDAAEEAIRRVGVNKYAMARDSRASGYAGSREILDALGPGKAWDGVKGSIETYLRQAANYVGASEAGKKTGEMFMDKEIKDNYPNAYRRAHYMWDQFVGVPRPLDEMLRTVSKAISTLPVFKNYVDDRTGHNLVSGAGNMFTSAGLVWLNPAFYLANGVQNFAVPSRMQQTVAKQLGGKGNISEALVMAEAHMALPTENTKKIIKEAMENGSLEARFAEALDWTQSSDAAIPILAKYALGEKVAAYADSYSRGKAYLSFYELGKSAGLTDAKAHSFAARESQGTMIQYDRWARMPVLNALGPIGDSVAPLTTFTTNMVFRLGDYMKNVAKGPKEKGGKLVAPLMTLLGLQVAIAGIKGLPFYEDLEKLWLELNKYYIEKWGGEPIPTPTEWMAEAGVPGILQDGVFSTALGVNMTGTMGMGTVGGNMGQMVGFEYIKDFVTSFYETAADTMNRRITRPERFDSMSKIFPVGAREPLRALLYENDPLAENTDILQNGQLVYQRNKKQQTAALLTGKAPLAEAEAKKAKYQFEQINSSINKAKTQARDKFLDSVLYGEKMSPYVERVMQHYPEVLDNINEAMEERLEKMNITHENRIVLKNKANATALQLAERVYANKRAYESQR